MRDVASACRCSIRSCCTGSATSGRCMQPLSEGRYPEGSQVKIRWQGPDHSAIDTVGRLPLDAARPETFLALASKLGETMDMDHVATLCMAHWPGQVSPWYHDLRRVARYGAHAGEVRDGRPVFSRHGLSGHERTISGRSISIALPGAGGVTTAARIPISTSVRYWRRQVAMRAAQTLETLVGAGPPTVRRMTRRHGGTESMRRARRPGRRNGLGATGAGVARRSARARLPSWSGPAAGPPDPGYLLLNPSTVVRRVGLDLPQLSGPPEIAEPSMRRPTTGPSLRRGRCPGHGVCLDSRERGRRRPSVDRLRLLAAGQRLCNEYFEAHVNPTTGALQSLRRSRNAAIDCRSNWLSACRARQRRGRVRRPRIR